MLIFECKTNSARLDQLFVGAHGPKALFVGWPMVAGLGFAEHVGRAPIHKVDRYGQWFSNKIRKPPL